MTPTPLELPAPWTRREAEFVLRVGAVDLGELLAPRRLAIWGGLLLAVALLALVIGFFGGDWAVAFGTAVFIGASIGIVTFLATLRAQRRVLELAFGPDAVRVGAEGDGTSGGASGGATVIPYRELHRLLIVHDGAPTRIRIATAAGIRRWTIGQLYRHDSVEAFIDELPGPLVERLRNAGLVGGTAVRRGVRVTDWRPRRG